MTLVFNTILAGEGSGALLDFFTAGRAVLIPKADGGFRPLGIGESCYRLMARAVLVAVGPVVGQRLMPHQLAVCTKGGCEIAGRLAQVMFDMGPRYAVGSLDMKNAFNSLRRGLSSICPLFKVLYGKHGQLFDSQGNAVGTSQTGVRQGDPLAVCK